MTVICTKCGALSVHQCQCLNPVTLTGHQAPLPPTDPAKPELPALVITCDRCGTTYKNNERHACPPTFTKPERQACDYCYCGYKPENCKGCGPERDSGYRWVRIGERITDTDEYLTSYGEWMQTGGLEFKCTVAKKYRRRIIQQEEQAKPERQASEIEKEAAIDSIELRIGRIIDFTHDNNVRAGDGKKLVELCRSLIAAHDYAKYIGAIEGDPQ